MFENLKQKKEYGIVQEALNSLNAVSEPHKSKIIAGFKALDALGNSMKGYKEADAMMDDAASALTAMTGIDVRKEGICPALALAIRKGTPSQISDAIARVEGAISQMQQNAYTASTLSAASLGIINSQSQNQQKTDAGLAVLGNQNGQILQILARAAVPSGFYTQPATTTAPAN